MGLRVNGNQGAKHLGCSRQYLSKIEKQGFIKRGADGLFDLDELKVTVCLQPKSPSSLKHNIPVSKNLNRTGFFEDLTCYWDQREKDPAYTGESSLSEEDLNWLGTKTRWHLGVIEPEDIAIMAKTLGNLIELIKTMAREAGCHFEEFEVTPESLRFSICHLFMQLIEKRADAISPFGVEHH